MANRYITIVGKFIFSPLSVAICLHMCFVTCLGLGSLVQCTRVHVLGSGEGGGEVEVAVKTLKEGSGEEDRVKFLQEAAIMGQFKHHNVVTMYGVVTEGEPVSVYV